MGENKMKQKLVSSLRSDLSTKAIKALNNAFKLLAQKQYSGLITCTGDKSFELQCAQIELLGIVIKSFDRDYSYQYMEYQFKRAYEKYLQEKKKYLIDLFGEDDYNKLFKVVA